MIIWDKKIFFSGLIIAILGALPLLKEYEIVKIPEVVPLSGTVYSAVIAVLGLIIMIFNLPRFIRATPYSRI